ncbi:hypothetical protein T05_12663 [Trichinella murrelli]|uniref:Uncharacterized protein n=1 Tax=Trichinella murrelli TaxID=144512 RepID=A0A0V0UD59_9BILA|nr:hypothetical protein T05_12663 [Trichinella murrelli]
MKILAYVASVLMVVGVRCVVRVQGRFPYNEINVHLETQEWKMDVNDRKTAISLTIRSKPLTARKRTREDKRDVNDEEKKKFKQGRHKAERRQYEVEQKKTGGAGGYLSGSILLVPAADIRKG